MAEETAWAAPAPAHDSLYGGYGLVLKRRPGERLVIRIPGITRPIVVSIARIERNNAWVAINADKSYRIDREEVDRQKIDADAGRGPSLTSAQERRRLRHLQRQREHIATYDANMPAPLDVDGNQ